MARGVPARRRRGSSRSALAVAFASLALAAACSAGAPVDAVDAPAAGYPDVIVLLADDLGTGDVGWAGGTARTPRLDRLAAEGVRFERFYANPLCSPSRAGLLTGRSISGEGIDRAGHGVAGNVQPGETGLRRDVPTLAEHLAGAGYATALVGKWHLGSSEGFHPLNRGFDSFYGLLGGWVDYETHDRDNTPDWWRGRNPLEEEGYATDLLADEAVRIVETRDPGRPLFLMVSFTAPHTPLQAPADRVERFASEPDDVRRVYLAMVAALDESVGRVLDAVEESGRARDTIVWFLGDNGGSPKFGASNGGLRGGKYSVYEGGLRVPSVLRWPAGLEGGVVHSGLATQRDVWPTVEALAGVPPSADPPAGGVDLTAALRGREAVAERDSLIVGVRAPVATRFALVTERWKLVQVIPDAGEGERVSLFDLSVDPGETTDRAAGHPDVVAGMLKRLRTWREGGGEAARSAE